MASTLPTDQDFDAGATVFGASLTGYIASGFWTAQQISPIIVADTVGVQPLHDGYRSGAGGTVPRQAAFASQSIGEKSAGVQMREPYTADDITVSMTMYAHILSGALTNSDTMIRRQFVGARISGGTHSAGASPPTNANPQRINDVDAGYFFGYTSNGTQAYWSLLKVGAGGAVTVLDSQIFANGGAFTGEIDPFSVHGISMQLVNVSGNVQITATATASTTALSAGDQAILTSSHLLGPISEWEGGISTGGTSQQTVFNYLDSTSAIQTAGRAGFVSTGVHGLGLSGPTNAVAVLVPNFTVRLATGPVVIRDEFLPWARRSCLRWSGEGYPSLTGSFAYDLRCGFEGDRFGASTSNGEVTRATAGGHADRIGVDDSGATELTGGYYGSMRSADDPITTHRRVQIQFSNADFAGAAATNTLSPGEFRQAGLFARADDVTSGVPQNAYSVDIRPTENSLAAWVKVRRWNVGVGIDIAEFLAPTIALTTDYTLALRAFNLPDAQGVPLTGIVVLEAYLDGVLVPLVEPASGAVNGIQVSSAGTVFDSGTERIGSGLGEGFRIAGVAGSDFVTTVDSWTQLAIEVTPGAGEADQLNVSLSNEQHDYTATELVVNHDWPTNETRITRRGSTDFETGHVRVSLQDPSIRRKWNLTARNTTTNERNILVAFFDARRGIEEAFDWTPPLESATVKVHFVDPRLGDTLKAPGVSSFDIELEEVL